MPAPSRLSKEQLVSLLIKKGYPENQVRGLKRPQLLEFLNEENEQIEEETKGEEAIEALDEVNVQEDTCVDAVDTPSSDDTKTANPSVEISDSNAVEETEEDKQDEEMDSSHKGWTQYVLGKLQSDEMEGKNPRVEGLRRVAEEVIGEIIEEGCNLADPPNIDNEMRACVKAWVVFRDECGTVKRFEALADAYHGNCTSDFVLYVVAMADTRAKGRCYRNALKLKRVLAAEEVDPAMAACQGEDNKQPIAPTQITGIRVVSERLGISIEKHLVVLGIECSLDKNQELDLGSLNKGSAKKVLLQLNKYNMSRDEIPDEIKEKIDG